MACGTIALLGSLAGTGASLGASALENNAMNKATNQELVRNQGFVNQARNTFNTSQQLSTPQAAQNQINQGKQQSLGYINSSALPSATLSMPQNAIPQNAGGNALQSGQNARNQLSNQASAGLQGYSNFGLQQYLKDLQANSNLGLIGNEANAWKNILPYQLQAASQSQTGLSTLGSLLSTGSNLAGLYGLTSSPSLGNMLGNSRLNQLGSLGQQGLFPMSTGMSDWNISPFATNLG